MRLPKSVIFPQPLRRSFARAAKKAFPAEVLAICLGVKHADGAVEIRQLFYPQNTTAEASGAWVAVSITAYPLAASIGRKDGLTICADLHSHCWQENWGILDATPSEHDWDAPKNHPHMVIHGICNVLEMKGKKYSRFRFWPCIKPIEMSK